MYPLDTNVNIVRGAPVNQNNDTSGASPVLPQSATYTSFLPNMTRQQNVMNANNQIEGASMSSIYTSLNNNVANTYNVRNNLVNYNVHNVRHESNQFNTVNCQDFYGNNNNNSINNNNSYNNNNNYANTINNSQHLPVPELQDNAHNNKALDERQIVQCKDNNIDNNNNNNVCNLPRCSSESSSASSSRIKFTWNPYASRLVENDKNKEPENSYSMSTFHMSYSDADKGNYSTSTLNAPAYCSSNNYNNNNYNNIYVMDELPHRDNEGRLLIEQQLQFQQQMTTQFQEQQQQQQQQQEQQQLHQRFQWNEHHEQQTQQNHYFHLNENSMNNNNSNMCAFNAFNQNQDIGCYDNYDQYKNNNNNNNNNSYNNNYNVNFTNMTDGMKYRTPLPHRNEQMAQIHFINNNCLNINNELDDMYLQPPCCSHLRPQHILTPTSQATLVFSDHEQPTHMPTFTFAKPLYYRTEESFMPYNSMQNSVDTLQKLESCIADDRHQCYVDFSSSSTSQNKSNNDCVCPPSAQTPQHKILESCSLIPSSFASSPATTQTTSTTEGSDKKESNTPTNAQAEASTLTKPVNEKRETPDANIDGQLVVYNDIIHIDKSSDEVNTNESNNYQKVNESNFVDSNNFYRYYKSLEDYINQTENLLKDIITIPEHPLIAQIRVGLYRPLVVDDHTPAVLTVLQTRPSFFITRMLPPPPLTSTLMLTTSNVETICAACRRWLIHVNAAITGQARRIEEDELMKTKVNNATNANNAIYVANTANKVDTNIVRVDDKDANPGHTNISSVNSNGNNNNIDENRTMTETTSEAHIAKNDDNKTCTSEVQIIEEQSISSILPEEQLQKEDKDEMQPETSADANLTVSVKTKGEERQAEVETKETQKQQQYESELKKVSEQEQTTEWNAMPNHCVKCILEYPYLPIYDQEVVDWGRRAIRWWKSVGRNAAETERCNVINNNYRKYKLINNRFLQNIDEEYDCNDYYYYKCWNGDGAACEVDLTSEPVIYGLNALLREGCNNRKIDNRSRSFPKNNYKMQHKLSWNHVRNTYQNGNTNYGNNINSSNNLRTFGNKNNNNNNNFTNNHNYINNNFYFSSF